MKWYEQEGNCGDVAVSSRVRLARNLADYPFPARLSASAAKEIMDNVSAFLTKETGCRFIDLSAADPITAGALVERHLISPELAGKGGSRGVALSEDESVSVMVNEEDHLRLQILGSGLCLGDCLEKAGKLDDCLEQHFSYAWDDKLGYLTHCPTNLGTGLRASVMLHLPAHTETGEIRALADTLAKLGFAVRGLYGEGSAAVGCLYQFSNQLTLGPTEAETVERLEKVVRSAIERERALRAKIAEENPAWLADRVWRAYGLLKYARRVSAAEAMGLLSDLRMGVGAEGMPVVAVSLLNRLIPGIQPNLLCAAAGRFLGEAERDDARAALLRESI